MGLVGDDKDAYFYPPLHLQHFSFKLHGHSISYFWVRNCIAVGRIYDVMDKFYPCPFADMYNIWLAAPKHICDCFYFLSIEEKYPSWWSITFWICISTLVCEMELSCISKNTWLLLDISLKNQVTMLVYNRNCASLHASNCQKINNVFSHYILRIEYISAIK